jgi:hypothetical protein
VAGSTVVTVTAEALGAGNGGPVYSGGLANHPIVPGTVWILAGGVLFRDDGAEGLVGSVPGSSGWVEYGTGGWWINTGGASLNSSDSIGARYQYYQ